MKIVVEYVLIQNMLINLITLKTCSLLLKENGRRVFLSAFLGACVTVVLPLMRLNTIGAFLVEIGLNIIVICISFKFKTLKKFIKIFLSHFMIVLLYGGGCYMIEKFFGIKSTLVVLAVVVALYVVVKILLKTFNRKLEIQNFCFDIEIENMGQRTKWSAFLDSGNLLFDPLTQSPVSLVNFKVFKEIFKEIGMMDVLTKSPKLKKLKMGHYISLNTLSSSDKIFVFQVDRLKIGDKIFEKAIMGLSLTNFNQAFGSDVILHNNCAL